MTFQPKHLTPAMVAQTLERTARERREQGLPPVVEDQLVLAKVARIVAGANKNAGRSRVSRSASGVGGSGPATSKDSAA